jgi:hypothetical protein
MPTTRYHAVRDVPLSEMSNFQWKGTCGVATSAHYVTDKKWNYSILYLYTNMVEVEPYFEKFDKIYWISRVQPHIEATRSHVRVWAQTWSKLSELVMTTFNLFLHYFSSLILLHQSCKMCNIVYSFICSVWRMPMCTMI